MTLACLPRTGGDPLAAIREAVSKACQAYATNGDLRIPVAADVVTAVRP